MSDDRYHYVPKVGDKVGATGLNGVFRVIEVIRDGPNMARLQLEPTEKIAYTKLVPWSELKKLEDGGD